MRLRLWFFFFSILWSVSTVGGGTSEPFTFHILTEPQSLDPQRTTSNSGNYLYNVLYRGLYSYHSQRGLELSGASSCERSRSSLVCKLHPQHRWSNGEKIQAQDYVRSFRRLADPDRKSPQSDLVFSLKNGRDIVLGHKPASSLGVSAPRPDTVRFEFAESDPEFEYKLINPATSPQLEDQKLDRGRPADYVVSGPYKIQSWKVGHGLLLVPNPHYGLRANPERPQLQALFVESDSTALTLYESGKLSFLRRVVMPEIPRFRGRPEFHQIPMARFDYVGFGPELEGQPQLRQALVSGLDFKTFRSLVDSKGEMGCAGLPSRLLGAPVCLRFAPEKAKQALKKLISPPPKLVLHISQMGGDDVRLTAEWLQGQWKTHLGIQVEIKSEEQVVYLRRLRADPPALFRKGLGLDRPTCRAALECFTQANPENYLKMNDSKLEVIVKKLNHHLSSKAQQELCRQGVEALLKTNRLIPLGEMYFSILMSTKFKGWDINEINQIDLSELYEIKPRL